MRFYWSAKPLLAQYKTDLEINFFNSRDRKMTAWNIYTVQLYEIIWSSDDPILHLTENGEICISPTEYQF